MRTVSAILAVAQNTPCGAPCDNHGRRAKLSESVGYPPIILHYLYAGRMPAELLDVSWGYQVIGVP
jgi:hypothetical protein